MRHVLFVLIGLLGFLPPARATSPCMPQTPEQFQTTKDASDLIAHVRILDYATHDGSPESEGSWTEAEIIQVYKGKEARQKIRVKGWTSYYQPLYTHDRGSEAVLLLKKDGEDYRMTDLSWKSCVPSLIGLPPGEPIQWRGEAMTRDAFIRARLGMEAEEAEKSP